LGETEEEEDGENLNKTQSEKRGGVRKYGNVAPVFGKKENMVLDEKTPHHS